MEGQLVKEAEKFGVGEDEGIKTAIGINQSDNGIRIDKVYKKMEIILKLTVSSVTISPFPVTAESLRYGTWHVRSV